MDTNNKVSVSRTGSCNRVYLTVILNSQGSQFFKQRQDETVVVIINQTKMDMTHSQT